ncbi:MAG: hypothetical protein PUA56_01310 [Bacillales bacterium]|nr:hypothetical protein [Bacillales bacterium]
MQDKVVTMIEFAIRSKKYSLGESCLNRGNKVKLALLALDTSETTKKGYINKLESRHIPYIIYGTKSELGLLLHKQEIALIGIEDINLAKQVIKIVKEGN